MRSEHIIFSTIHLPVEAKDYSIICLDYAPKQFFARQAANRTVRGAQASESPTFRESKFVFGSSSALEQSVDIRFNASSQY